MIMTAVRDNEGSPKYGFVGQVATTVFVGVPVTAVLFVGLACYFTFHLLKYALFAKKSPAVRPPDELGGSHATTEVIFTSVHTEPPRGPEVEPPAAEEGPPKH
jgi:hypothetical protein